MPEPFSARKVNLDGSRNIFCNRCHEFICAMSSMEAFNSALCVVCQAADRGEIFPEEVLRQLRSRKIGDNYIPLYIAEPEIPPDPMGDDLSIKSGRLEYYVQVVSRKVKEAVQKIKAKSKESRAIAKEKRKPRVFDREID